MKMLRLGYTLIEVLVVVLIISILIGLLLPVGQTVLDKMRISRAKADIAKIEAAAESYNSTHGAYPLETASDTVPVSKLEEFMDFPAKQVSSTNEFMDPWGQAYKYKRHGTNHPSFIDMAASGPDAQISGAWQQDSNIYGGADPSGDVNDDNINNWFEKR